MAVGDSVVGLHPDRLRPAEPSERAIASRLYGAVGDAGDLTARPCRSELRVDARPFPDPRGLSVTPDHHVPRLDTPTSPN
jgi:glucuronate isomerase